MSWEYFYDYLLSLVPWILFWEFSKFVVKRLIQDWRRESEILNAKNNIHD